MAGLGRLADSRGTTHVNWVTVIPAGRTVGLCNRRPRVERLVAQIKGGNMTLHAHLDSLKERHAALDARIVDEDQRPQPDPATLTRLKVEKLHIKEEIERLRAQDH
jgi:hypothetical protein